MREVLRGLQGGDEKGEMADRREEGRRMGGAGPFCLLEERESGGVGGTEGVEAVVGPGAFRIYQQAVSMGGAGEVGAGGKTGQGGGEKTRRENFGDV